MSQFCTTCGQVVPDSGTFCGACGAKRDASVVTPSPAPNIREQEFFSDSLRGIRVTNARFITGTGKVYAMAGITSVALARTPDRRGWPVLFLAITLLWALAGARTVHAIAFAAVLSAAFAAWIKGAGPRWIVRLFTSGGQAEEVESGDRAFVGRVVAGLNEAIVARGRVVL